jgi:hypothetical protein
MLAAMSKIPFDLEEAIGKWRRRMDAAGLGSPAHLDELDSHLREDIERLMKLGLTESEAFAASTHSIGQPEVVTNEFKKVEAGRNLRVRDFLLALPAGLVVVTAMGTVRETNFTLGILFGLSLGFGVLLAQIKNGVLDPAKLIRMRPYALVINFIMGAILTGPRLDGQVAMAAVLQLFYEGSIVIARYLERRQTSAQPE